MAKQSKHGQRHFCIGARKTATNVSARARPAALVSPQARERASATERLQLSAGVADRAEVGITAPRRSPVALPHAAPREGSRRRRVRVSADVTSKPKPPLALSASSPRDVTSTERDRAAEELSLRCLERRKASIITGDAEVT